MQQEFELKVKNSSRKSALAIPMLMIICALSLAFFHETILDALINIFVFAAGLFGVYLWLNRKNVPQMIIINDEGGECPGFGKWRWSDFNRIAIPFPSTNPTLYLKGNQKEGYIAIALSALKNKYEFAKIVSALCPNFPGADKLKKFSDRTYYFTFVLTSLLCGVGVIVGLMLLISCLIYFIASR